MRPSYGARPRLAIVASHPVQYQAPLFRELASRLDLRVFFAHRATPADQARAGFGVEFDWDADLLSGYPHVFLDNVAPDPGLHHHAGCDTPGIDRALSDGRFDALLVQGWHLRSYVQAIRAARRLGLPVMARGDSQLDTPRCLARRAIKAVTYPMLLRRFDAALYVGEKSRSYWRHYHYPENRLFFSPHCVDNDWFRVRAGTVERHALRARLGIRDDERVVLFAGKLVEFKRPLDVIDAAGMLRAAHSVRVLVAGSGPLEDQMASRARELGVPADFLGFCNQSEMPAAYAAADLLALPSDGRETWGLVANEALACGTPVLLSDQVGSAPDLAGDGEAGRIFEFGHPARLADQADALLRRPPRPDAIAKRIDAYSLEAAAAGIVQAMSAVRAVWPLARAD